MEKSLEKHYTILPNSPIKYGGFIREKCSFPHPTFFSSYFLAPGVDLKTSGMLGKCPNTKLYLHPSFILKQNLSKLPKCPWTDSATQVEPVWWSSCRRLSRNGDHGPVLPVSESGAWCLSAQSCSYLRDWDGLPAAATLGRGERGQRTHSLTLLGQTGWKAVACITEAWVAST